ncbi:MAG TPA: preprotein translocase subunit SecG [Gemmatimonadaceae bacterium]
MYTFLLIILILDALVLIAAVLMQAAKGGGLAASFGGVSTAADSFIGTRQAGNVLTKIAWWAGGLFLGIAFVLQLMSTRGRTPTSILDQGLSRSPATTPAPVTPPPQSVVPLGPPDKGTPPPPGSEKK